MIRRTTCIYKNKRQMQPSHQICLRICAILSASVSFMFACGGKDLDGDTPSSRFPSHTVTSPLKTADTSHAAASKPSFYKFLLPLVHGDTLASIARTDHGHLCSMQWAYSSEFPVAKFGRSW